MVLGYTITIVSALAISKTYTKSDRHASIECGVVTQAGTSC